MINNNSRSLFNIVTFDVSTQSLSFEYFDVNNYQKRENAAYNYGLDANDINIDSNVYATTFTGDSLYTKPYYPNFETINERMSAGIVGSDNRTIVSNPQNLPYCLTGYINAVYYVEDSGISFPLQQSGTGFIQGPNNVVTAAHVIYKDITSEEYGYEDNIENPRFPDEIIFTLYKNTSMVQELDVSKVNISMSYWADLDENNDWAVFELTENIGSSIGWYGKVSNWYENNAPVKTYGYPVDNEPRMISCLGSLIGTTEYIYRTNLDLTSGQSGSPVLMTHSDNKDYVCGIASSYNHILGVTTYTNAIRYDNFLFHFLNSYITSSGNVIFPEC